MCAPHPNKSPDNLLLQYPSITHWPATYFPLTGHLQELQEWHEWLLPHPSSYSTNLRLHIRTGWCPKKFTVSTLNKNTPMMNNVLFASENSPSRFSPNKTSHIITRRFSIITWPNLSCKLACRATKKHIQSVWCYPLYSKKEDPWGYDILLGSLLHPRYASMDEIRNKALSQEVVGSIPITSSSEKVFHPERQ